MGLDHACEFGDDLDPKARSVLRIGIHGFGNLVQVPAQGKELLIRPGQGLQFRLSDLLSSPKSTVTVVVRFAVCPISSSPPTHVETPRSPHQPVSDSDHRKEVRGGDRRAKEHGKTDTPNPECKITAGNSPIPTSPNRDMRDTRLERREFDQRSLLEGFPHWWPH